METLLNDSLERTSAIDRIVPFVGNLFTGSVGHVQRESVFFEAFFQPHQLQIDKTTAHYGDYIKRLQEINGIKPTGQP